MLHKNDREHLKYSSCTPLVDSVLSSHIKDEDQVRWNLSLTFLNARPNDLQSVIHDPSRSPVPSLKANPDHWTLHFAVLWPSGVRAGRPSALRSSCQCSAGGSCDKV